MKREHMRRLLLCSPYLITSLLGTKLAQSYRLSWGNDFATKVRYIKVGFERAFQSLLPSFHPDDLIFGVLCGLALALAVYVKVRNAKKYRMNEEYGSARWGNHEDIAPYMDEVPEKNVILKDKYKDWIWSDAERRQALVEKYNRKFNSVRPREYDGKHIKFHGMSPEITLKEHQINAIARILYGGNTLLAHEVGAGKTFEMVAAAMEAKALGLCTKSLITVPNHLTGQWASEFLRLYPSANILVATKKDFEKANRKKFCARIATGDYDAVIIGHSQFEKIPISDERQEALLRAQILEISEGIKEFASRNGAQFTVKQLESSKRKLEKRLEKLLDSDKKDDVITFEQLGVDRLFVDEAHSYKNLFLYTKMRNIAGLSTSEAQKSSDMFAKCRYMDEITGGKGNIFATGTPVSNSMTELYTMQRYLQYDELVKRGLIHFDAWASIFGETTTAIELAPEGTGYRARTRFAKFFNLPELMRMFKEVADIKLADELDLPRPKANHHNIVAPPTEHQKKMVEKLSERAQAIHDGLVNPSEDNMFLITSDGRKLGLDQRLIDIMLPDEDGTKVNLCVDNVYETWKSGANKKLTQLIFSDISTPQKNDDSFTIYSDIRQKLVARGVPADEVAFIHEANTEVQKEKLFAKVRAGQVRVLMGSTSKMGAGTNCQDKLIALHDLDAPWRPGDLAQRSGRIVRQGNTNPEVDIYRYVTEGTFDSYLWQTLENKQKFISQIMTSKSPVRSCEDIDETTLSFAELKALCAGNPLIKEKMDLDNEVSRLKVLKSSFSANLYRLEDNVLKKFPEEIEKYKGFIKGFEKDIEAVKANPLPTEDFIGMEIHSKDFFDKEKAGAALIEACKSVNGSETVLVGAYRGFLLSVEYSHMEQEYVGILKGEMSHRTPLGTDPRGNIQRLDNVLSKIPSRLENTAQLLENTYKQLESAKAEIGKTFPQEDELTEKSARLIEVNAALDMDKGGGEVMAFDDENNSPQVAANLSERGGGVRTSVLEKLKVPCQYGDPRGQDHAIQEVR